MRSGHALSLLFAAAALERLASSVVISLLAGRGRPRPACRPPESVHRLLLPGICGGTALADAGAGRGGAIVRAGDGRQGAWLSSADLAQRTTCREAQTRGYRNA